MTIPLFKQSICINEESLKELASLTAEFFKENIQKCLNQRKAFTNEEYEIYSKEYGELILSPRSFRTLSDPRMHLLYYLHIKDYRITLKELGELFGGRDHSTIIHFREQMKWLLLLDKKYNFDVHTSRFKEYVLFLEMERT